MDAKTFTDIMSVLWENDGGGYVIDDWDLVVNTILGYFSIDTDDEVMAAAIEEVREWPEGY